MNFELELREKVQFTLLRVEMMGGGEKGEDSSCESSRRRLLKAPPANPRTYIYRYYNIDPTEGS